jgi:hypothetical protein
MIPIIDLTLPRMQIIPNLISAVKKFGAFYIKTNPELNNVELFQAADNLFGTPKQYQKSVSCGGLLEDSLNWVENRVL